MLNKTTVFIKKNWLKTVLLIGAGLFVLSEYGWDKSISIFSVLLCMFLTILNIAEIYLESKHYILNKRWNISTGRVVYLMLSSVAIALLAIFILTKKAIIFSFSFAGLILFALLVYEIVEAVKRRNVS